MCRVTLQLCNCRVTSPDDAWPRQSCMVFCHCNSVTLPSFPLYPSRRSLYLHHGIDPTRLRVTESQRLQHAVTAPSSGAAWVCAPIVTELQSYCSYSRPTCPPRRCPAQSAHVGVEVWGPIRGNFRWQAASGRASNAITLRSTGRRSAPSVRKDTQVAGGRRGTTAGMRGS